MNSLKIMINKFKKMRNKIKFKNKQILKITKIIRNKQSSNKFNYNNNYKKRIHNQQIMLKIYNKKKKMIIILNNNYNNNKINKQNTMIKIKIKKILKNKNWSNRCKIQKKFKITKKKKFKIMNNYNNNHNNNNYNRNKI